MEEESGIITVYQGGVEAQTGALFLYCKNPEKPVTSFGAPRHARMAVCLDFPPIEPEGSEAPVRVGYPGKTMSLSRRSPWRKTLCAVMHFNERSTS